MEGGIWVQEGGRDICVYTADLPCYTAEADKSL